MATRRTAPYRLIIWLVLLAIAALVFVSLPYQQKIQSGWVVTCDNGECVASGHFHFDLALTVCGQPVQLEAEAGKLSSHHTHKEPNKIHWHSALPAEGKTRQPRTNALLTLDKVLQDFSISKQCDDRPAGYTVAVNGKPSDLAALSYQWQDGDNIEITISPVPENVPVPQLKP